MKRFFISAIVAAAIMAVDAATVFDWCVDLPRNYAHNCSLYQGTTGVFSPHICSNGVEIAGLEFEGLYYQTNGMGNAWWRLDSLTFAPANDCGAAQYRFFIRHVSSADSSIHYDAQGILRMLPSPGFTPNAIAAPVATLDFATVEVLNAPWPDEADIADATNAVAQAARAYTDEAANTLSPQIAELQHVKADSYTISTNFLPATFTSNDFWVVDFDGLTILKLAPHPYAQYYWVGTNHNNTTFTLFDCTTPARYIEYSITQYAPEYISSSFLTEEFDIPIYPVIIDGQQDGIYPYPSEETASYCKLRVEYDGVDLVEPIYIRRYGGFEIVTNSVVYSDSLADATNATAQAAEAYTDAAIAGIDRTETDPVWSAEKSQYATTNDLSVSQRVVLALMQGTNVLAVVTNYNSAVHLPELSLKYLDGDNGYIEVWRETRRIDAATNALHQIEAAALATGLATKADAAWSRTTSGLGQEAPSNTTWISTAATVIAGGYEYAKTVTSNGDVFILTSNGMDLGFAQGATNSFLSVSAADGTPIFMIEKTDSYLVGVDPSAISVVGGTCLVSLPIVATTHPFARVATNLVNAVWSKEDENGMPAGSPATVSWSGTSGAYVATVDFGTSPQGYCYFEFLQEGMTKIVNAGATDLSGGIFYGGHLYSPTVSGTQLIFERVRND